MPTTLLNMLFIVSKSQETEMEFPAVHMRESGHCRHSQTACCRGQLRCGKWQGRNGNLRASLHMPAAHMLSRSTTSFAGKKGTGKYKMEMGHLLCRCVVTGTLYMFIQQTECWWDIWLGVYLFLSYATFTEFLSPLWYNLLFRHHQPLKRCKS